jgi:hypothetical protein
MPWPAWLHGNGGRPEKYCRRLIADAIRYVADSGCFSRRSCGRMPRLKKPPANDLLLWVTHWVLTYATCELGVSTGRHGQPISPGHLGRRLKKIGIHAGRDRSTALFALATEIPARMLGIHIKVAVAWQQASSGIG